MKNSSQTQHHRPETKTKVEKKIKNNEAGSNGTIATEIMEQCLESDFRYGIAKISQGLQKFCNDSENFAIPAKFSLCYIFAMIAKIHYHGENSLS